MIRIMLAMLLLAGTVAAQEYRQVTEYVTSTQRVCQNGVCRLVQVRRPVTRWVEVVAESNEAEIFVSSLADVASAPPKVVVEYAEPPVTTYVEPRNYHRHVMADGTIMEHHDSNHGSASAHAGVVGWGGMRWPKYTGPLAPGMLATVPTAESLDVSQYVDYAAIEQATGLRFFQRWAERRQMRRQGRMVNVAVFARSGINRRLQALANFMPRAWFNLR